MNTKLYMGASDVKPNNNPISTYELFSTDSSIHSRDLTTEYFFNSTTDFTTHQLSISDLSISETLHLVSRPGGRFFLNK